jgi:DNA replication and repair protein RecF
VYIERLALTDFRSHADVDLTLAPGVVAFVGANGQGKTNLVEAIGYLATLSSHRVAQDAPLVRRGAERAYVRAAVNKEGRTTTLEVEIAPGRANRARINGSPLPRARELLGILKTVLFAPEDLALVKGEPSDRRYFLDTLLVTRTPRIAGVISDFERTLKQRNALLRSASGVRRFDTSTLDVWDEHLAEHGAQVIAARMELIAALEPLVRSAYHDLADDAVTQIAYKANAIDYHDPSTDAIKHMLLATLKAMRSQEIDRGVTLVGPQRDDLQIDLGDGPAKGYASHGESWSIALALRLASYNLLTSEGDQPVLILDDVFAELDEARRAHLSDVVRSAEQVLITAAVGADLPITMGGQRILVDNGQVRTEAS